MHYNSRGLRVNVYIFFTIFETELEGRSNVGQQDAIVLTSEMLKGSFRWWEILEP